MRNEQSVQDEDFEFIYLQRNKKRNIGLALGTTLISEKRTKIGRDQIPSNDNSDLLTSQHLYTKIASIYYEDQQQKFLRRGEVLKKSRVQDHPQD